jgi:DNA-binding IclR family transcriptional regulator
MNEIKSIAKAIRVINYLADHHEGSRTSDIAHYLEFDKSIVSRILKTLSQYNFAEKSTTDNKYYLGNKLIEISQLATRGLSWKDKVKPFLKELVKETGECAHLGVLVQDRVLYLDQENNYTALKVEHEIGARSPLHCTALGKIFLAFGGAAIPKQLEVFTKRTITNPVILKEHLQQVIEKKFAIDDEEYDIGIRCVAAPIYNKQNKLIGSIGVSGPVARISLDDLDIIGNLTVTIAERCSKLL